MNWAKAWKQAAQITWADVLSRTATARAAERERCAKIAETDCEEGWVCDCGHNHPKEIAAKIRGVEIDPLS